METAASFGSDYPEARGKFLVAAKAAGAALEAVVNPNRGPDGGELATDVAWIGPRDAERVLVMLSGTHGVEGFCGSGAQVDWLRRAEWANLPAGTAAMLVHAVNPYGFGWLRRVTEENVDLNRNWVDFGGQLPANPDYAVLSEALCPADWSEETQARTLATIGAWAAEHGFAAMQQAVSGGQYNYPDGLFFGGKGPTWARRTLTEIYRSYLGQAGRVAIIDYHTGLGPWGFGERIITARAGEPQFERARAWYGVAVTSPMDGTSTSADIAGDGLSAAPGLLAHAEVTGMALEYGTLTTMEVIGALRADAWLHGHGDLDSDQGRAIKAQIRNAFYGDDDGWKGMVTGQSLLACRAAVAGLQAD